MNEVDVVLQRPNQAMHVDRVMFIYNTPPSWILKCQQDRRGGFGGRGLSKTVRQERVSCTRTAVVL